MGTGYPNTDVHVLETWKTNRRMFKDKPIVYTQHVYFSNAIIHTQVHVYLGFGCACRFSTVPAKWVCVCVCVCVCVYIYISTHCIPVLYMYIYMYVLCTQQWIQTLAFLPSFLPYSIAKKANLLLEESKDTPCCLGKRKNPIPLFIQTDHV